MVKFIDPTDEVQEYEVVTELNLQKGIIGLSVSKQSVIEKWGGWKTHLPVSPPEYRKKHTTTLAAVNVFEGVDEITFNITDDYGTEYILTITGDEMKNPIVVDEVKKLKNLT